MLTFMKNIEIVLPKEDNDGNQLNWTSQLKEACKWFGGYTLFEQSGGWVSEGRLFTDESNLLRLSYDVLSAERIAYLNSLLSELFTTQLAVLVNFNNQTAIIDKYEQQELIEYIKGM